MMWHVGILKATLTYGIWLQPSLASTNVEYAYPARNLANGMQNQPRTPCTYMACVHFDRDIGQWHATSAKAFLHRRWCVHIDRVISASAYIRQHQPRTLCLENDTSTYGKRHHQGKICRALPHHLWFVHITQQILSVDCLYRLWVVCIT